MSNEPPAKLRISELNALSRGAFVEKLGGIYEHSAWVAETVAGMRPFIHLDGLKDLMANAVSTAPPAKRMELIRAHPDLAGRLAQQGQLTPESTKEQASAGLSDATADVINRIQKMNERYRMRFDFPFIICARLNKVDAILSAMEARVTNDPDTEVAAALAEIHKIASLRLDDILTDD